MALLRARWDRIPVLQAAFQSACRDGFMLALCAAALLALPCLLSAGEVVSFPNGNLVLRGVLYQPADDGPFPAVLFNHGSARDNTAASSALGPLLASRGWVLFMPHRHRQGLSWKPGRT
jgi:hypothetical protein